MTAEGAPPVSETDRLREAAEQFGIAWTVAPSIRRSAVPTPAGIVSALVWGESVPRIALFHGGGLDARTWDATLLALGEPAVAVDLPGHGASSRRDDADHRPETIVDAVDAALAELAPGPVVLAGQSLGGLTALLLATRDPVRFGRVVVIGATPDVGDVTSALQADFHTRWCAAESIDSPVALAALLADELAALEAPGGSAIDRALSAARARISRLAPEQVDELRALGALVVDTRPVEQRDRFGRIPGAIAIDRNVLEWRLDPTSAHRHPAVVGHTGPIVVLCQQGYSSSLAVATLRALGIGDVHDLAGGFEAWIAAGLPVE